jgi:hypothetical protein
MSVAPSAGGAHSEPPPLQPNAGAPPVAPKRWYVSERIIVTDVGTFHNDHDLRHAAPGFHIFGLCPSCGHDTSSVCATEYLAQDVDSEHGRPERSAAVAARGVVPWDGEVGEVRRLQGARGGVGGVGQLQGEGGEAGGTPSPTDYLRHYWSKFTTTHPIAEGPTAGDRGAPEEQAPEPTPKTMLTVMRCACTFNHVAQQGAPAPAAGAFGCGSQWMVRVLYDDDTAQAAVILPAGELEAAYCWPAADAAAAQVPKALTNAQASAKNWGAGLTAILTLGGIGALLTNESTVRSLNTFWQVMFGIAAFIAVIANGVMLYQSTIASCGSSRSADDLRPSDLRDADLDLLIQARATVRKLRTAILATAVAVVAALFAAGILLYGTTTPAPTTPTTTSVVTQTQP